MFISEEDLQQIQSNQRVQGKSHTNQRYNSCSQQSSPAVVRPQDEVGSVDDEMGFIEPA
jgi:hypothetical protein